MRIESLCRRGALSGLLLLASLLVVPPALAGGWDVDRLMAALAGHKSGKATFVEKTHMEILDIPLESSGELVFVAPDHLEKRTRRPTVESLVLDGQTLTIERSNQTTVLQLGEYPEVSAFIESIRGTLAGDRQALERQYRLSLKGSAKRWTLTLVPISARMRGIVRRITIQGTQGKVNSVEYAQSGGDYSTMTITDTAAP